ncbi:glycosyl hydrolase family 18 protein [Deinococcus cellulosilyticus]|uniref:chitinase n=1 Tax=Deinococcus cellulosilyticus (strain DSM 18568 / NBRC 106333 / KACC 11606 / 5516J-15) TaxID=1223518 RepID=A0A511MXR0_DEIC1|nr:glycosyl hydrolase family 18 protein [Deinococcus cellulosilyticus]GEM44916.1 chitinase [Deinococcus cellulosilyticus NBRC 106333 = KACC 11606]
MKKSLLITGLLVMGAVTFVGCSSDTAPVQQNLQVSQQAAVLSATFTTSSAWDSGFNGVITLKNTGDTAVSTWSLNFKFNGNAGISGAPWGAGGNAVKNADGSYTITPNSWGGGNIPAGGSVTVSYSGTGVFSGVTACTISGQSCSGTPSDTVAPTVSATVAPSTLTAAGTAKVTATASDNVGVTKVEFFRNGTLVATDTTAPYEYSQSFSSSSQNGTYAFTAKAFDAAGNNKTSTATNLTVNIPGTGDTIAPTVSLAASPTSLTAAGNVNLTATASDNVGVTKVEFYRGTTLIATDTTAPYTYADSFSSSAQNGTYSYTAKAFDAAGNNKTSTAVTATVNIPVQPGGNYRRVAYFSQWGIYGRGYLVKNIETSGTAPTLTHINYAFGNVYAQPDGTYKCGIVTRAESGNQDGGDGFADYQKGFSAAESVDGVADVWDQKLKGNFNQLKKLKTKYPNLKVLISLGGWTWSKWFSNAASTDALRKTLVSSCIDVYIKGNLPVDAGSATGGAGVGAGVFDGIDIDWEYPGGGGLPTNTVSAADKQNFTLLLKEFRTQLDALGATNGKKYQLTIAAPGGADKVANQEPALYKDYLDFINIMTYDFRGAWDATGPTNFHSNLYTDPSGPGTAPAKNYSVDSIVNTFLSAGVPANKLVVGIPFYGRGWTGVPNVNNGLYQSATGAARGTYEAGIEDYKVLKNFAGTKFRHPVTKQMWVYDGSTFWSYDDEQVIQEKANYIKSKGLGGSMVWSLDGDDSTGTLAKAIYNNLK